VLKSLFLKKIKACGGVSNGTAGTAAAVASWQYRRKTNRIGKYR
jgi:hypothetical protein